MIYEIYTENGTKKKRALTGDGYGLPLGTVIAYEGSVPDGFLACDGSAYNTTTYSALYALLGVGTTPDLTSQKMTNTNTYRILTLIIISFLQLLVKSNQIYTYNYELVIQQVKKTAQGHGFYIYCHIRSPFSFP